MKLTKSKLLVLIILLAIGSIVMEFVWKTEGATLIIMGFLVMPSVIGIYYYIGHKEKE